MHTIRALNYKLRLEPDLKQFTFDGSMAVLLEADEPVAQVTLHAIGLTIHSCAVQVEGVARACPFETDAAEETLCIRLPMRMQGTIHLAVDYRGEINDKMAGFYRSRYAHQGAEAFIAVTQFQESDARRAFPCLDHPACKATFDLELTVDRGLVAVANTPACETQRLPDGRQRVVFERTPRMSTYLVFWGVGRFEIRRDAADPRLRVVTLPDRARFGEYGLDFGRKALQYCESYFAIPYPLAKLDLIAVPDFAFGAMENWGAITFRENLLLTYPGITSRAGEERICEIIAHEIAHQWFGNLVTPSDWKYLWLNESFATYFGYGAVAHHHPAWETWERFLLGQTQTALERDALHETVPIEIPGGAHVVINTSTAPIIYNKGGSILRQVEGFIGSESFREGLRRYLNTHAYGCAASRHLWEALEAVSGRPVTRLMQSWIAQPGFPEIEVRRERTALVFTQRRFSYLPNEFDQHWIVPAELDLYTASGGHRRETLLLEDRATRLEIDPATVAYKLNAGQTGFYRVRYTDAANVVELGRRVADKTLPAADRWGLQSDLFAQVKSGAVSLEAYLEFLDWYREEDGYLPLAGIAGHLHEAFLLAAGQAAAPVAAAGRALIVKALGRLGVAPLPQESYTAALLREQLLWAGVLFGCREAADVARGRFQALTAGQNVHPDLLKSALQAGAWEGDGQTFDWFDRRFGSAESEHERLNVLIAMGCFSDPALLEQAFRYALEKVPERNRFVPIVAMAANPRAVPHLWQWYERFRPELERMHPLLYERIIAGVLPVGGIDRPAEVRAFLDRYATEFPQAAAAIRLAREKLEINLQLHSAQAGYLPQ